MPSPGLAPRSLAVQATADAAPYLFASWQKLDVGPRQQVRSRSDELTIDDVLKTCEDPGSVAQLKQLTGIEVLWAHVPGSVDVPGPQRPLPLGYPYPARAGFSLHVVAAGEDEEMTV